MFAYQTFLIFCPVTSFIRCFKLFKSRLFLCGCEHVCRSLLYRNVSLPTAREGNVFRGVCQSFCSRFTGGRVSLRGRGGRGSPFSGGLPREGSLKLFNTPVKAGPHTAYFLIFSNCSLIFFAFVFAFARCEQALKQFWHGMVKIGIQVGQEPSLQFLTSVGGDLSSCPEGEGVSLQSILLLVLTFSGGHCSRRYESYWNAFLFLCCRNHCLRDVSVYEIRSDGDIMPGRVSFT